MALPDYEELKKELVSMAEVVKQYPEALQLQVLGILVKKYLGQPVLKESGKVEGFGGLELDEELDMPSGGGRKKSAVKETAQIVKDLNLASVDGKPSFRDFFDEKKPETFVEFNAVSVYYLTKTRGLSEITPNHIYTCYKSAERKVPPSLRASLRETSRSRYGYIDASDMNNLKMSIHGENFVEHELPVKAGRQRQEGVELSPAS